MLRIDYRYIFTVIIYEQKRVNKFIENISTIDNVDCTHFWLDMLVNQIFSLVGGYWVGIQYELTCLIRYVGKPDFQPGWWVGIHYDEPICLDMLVDLISSLVGGEGYSMMNLFV